MVHKLLASVHYLPLYFTSSIKKKSGLGNRNSQSLPNTSSKALTVEMVSDAVCICFEYCW